MLRLSSSDQLIIHHHDDLLRANSNMTIGGRSRAASKVLPEAIMAPQLKNG